MNTKILNYVLCIFCLMLVLTALGSYIFPTSVADLTGEGGLTLASYFMLFLFGPLTLLFGYRALKAPSGSGT